MTTIIILTISLFLVGAFILAGLRKILASPPHLGQKTIWGKRIPGKYVKEGWRWLPPFPFNHGIIPVKVERITLDVIVEGVRTPDRAESKVPVTLTFRPVPELLIQYIDSGKEDGVKKQLGDKIQERVREWGMGTEEGPANWIELNQSQLEATSVLIKKIAGKSLAIIPNYAQEVPTWIWLRYYSKPQPMVFLENEKTWAKNGWAKVEDVLRMLQPEEVEKLETAVKSRRKQINDLRAGLSKIIVIKDLGIAIERLNIGDIDVLGEVAKQAENEAKENQERKGEALELQHLIEQVGELKKTLNCSSEQALEIFQTERGKVTKNIKEKKWSIAPETREMLEKSLSTVGLQILELLTKKKEAQNGK